MYGLLLEVLRKIFFSVCIMVVVFSIRFVGGNDEKYFMFSLYGFCGVGYVLSFISLVIMLYKVIFIIRN